MEKLVHLNADPCRQVKEILDLMRISASLNTIHTIIFDAQQKPGETTVSWVQRSVTIRAVRLSVQTD